MKSIERQYQDEIDDLKAQNRKLALVAQGSSRGNRGLPQVRQEWPRLATGRHRTARRGRRLG